MAGESPAAVLVDGVNGVELAVVRGAPIPALTRALLFAGEDGSGSAQVILINPDGSISVEIPQPTTPVTTVVPRTIVSTTLLAANPSRKGGTIYNDIASGILLVKIGAGAALGDFSFAMSPGFLYELPFPVYVGQISGIWITAGSGQARITETT